MKRAISLLLVAVMMLALFAGCGEKAPAASDVAMQYIKAEDAKELLLKLKETYTIVIVTHNLFQAKRIADECIFMLNGEIWEQNSTEELFRNPQRKETKDYLQGVYA